MNENAIGQGTNRGNYNTFSHVILLVTKIIDTLLTHYKFINVIARIDFIFYKKNKKKIKKEVTSNALLTI